MDHVLKILADLMQQDVCRLEIKTMFSKAPGPLLNLARRLQKTKKWDESLTILQFILDVQPDHPDARQCLADLYYEKGDLQASLLQYQALQQRGYPLDVEGFKNILFSIAQKQRQLDKTEAFDEVIELTRAAITLHPLLNKSGIMETLEAQRFGAHVRKVDLYRNLRDVQQELACRVAIWKDPLDKTRPGVLRLQNIYFALACIFMNKVAPGHIQLARAMLDSVATIPFSEQGDGLGGHDVVYMRYFRELFSRIDLDLVTGPPLQKFHMETGILIDSETGAVLGDLQGRARALGCEVVFYTSSSQLFANRYLKSYLAAILGQCDGRFMVIVELVLHDAEDLRFIDKVGIRDKRVIYWTSPFRPSYDTHGVLRSDQQELGHPSSYYGSLTLLRMSHLIHTLQVPTIVCGIDTILQKSVRDFLRRYETCDFVLNQTDEPSLASQVINSLILLNPTPNASLFANFMGHIVWKMLQEKVQPHGQEQMYLLLAKHHVLLHGCQARIGYFEQHDINNVMFDRHNLDRHKDMFDQFTFINIFASGLMEGRHIFAEEGTVSSALF